MMRRTDTVGLLAVLAVLGGLFSVTQVWAAAPAREPVQVVKSGTTVTLYGIVFASPTAGWVVGSGGTILATTNRSEEHTSELQSRQYLVCRLLLEKKKTKQTVKHQIRQMRQDSQQISVTHSADEHIHH